MYVCLYFVRIFLCTCKKIKRKKISVKMWEKLISLINLSDVGSTGCVLIKSFVMARQVH
jgi:hypothetical protein